MLKRAVPCLALFTMAGAMIAFVANAPAQPGVDKKSEKKEKGKKGDNVDRLPDRLDRLRRQLDSTRPPDPERQTLLSHSAVWANKADQLWRTQQPYIADRTLAAAEALFRASDHLQHLAGAPGFPPPPPPPPAEDLARHLGQVYFRTRQADYFLQEIHDNTASPLASLARQYYQRAVQAYDRSNLRAADEYGKMGEELVKALECLAQAATIAPGPGTGRQ